MATYDPPTTNYSLPKLDGSSDISDVDDGIGALADAVDAVMAGRGSGTLAGRPVTAPDGFLYRTTDTGQVFLSTGAAWLELGVSPWNPGDLKFTWATAAPAGWLMCDGAAVSRTTYAALFAAIGSSAGAGNGSTTFNVPDFRGRGFVMPDGTAGRLAGPDSRGAAGGAETHLIDFANLPSSYRFLSESSPGPSDYGAGAKDTNPGGGAAMNTMDPYLVGGAVLIKT